MDDTTFAFVKVPAPRIVPDTTSLLADTLLEIRSGSACTLTVTAAGTPPYTFHWYRDTLLVDSLSGDTLILDSLMPADSGLYYCEIKGRWGQARSDSVFIRWLPPINNAPVAVHDTFTIAEDGTLAITGEQSILNNNIEADGDTLTVVMVDSTKNGALTLTASGTFTYKPANNFAGADSFIYKVKDNKGAQSEPAVVRIIVSAVDDPPVALGQSVSLNEDGSLAITLSATDPEGSAIAGWEIPIRPKHGTLTGAGAVRTYMPEPDFFGADTFMFRVNDLVNWSDTGIVAITVLPVNDAPQWKNKLLEIEAAEGRALSIELADVFDKDPDGDSVYLKKVSGIGTLDAANWMWFFTVPSKSGDQLQSIIEVCDTGLQQLSNELTIQINVTDSMCELTINVVGKGTVEGAGIYSYGDSVKLIARPDTGAIFRNWSVNGSNAGQDTILTVKAADNISITAIFEGDPCFADSIAPEAPDLSVEVLSYNTVRLQWTKVNDNCGIYQYRIFKNEDSIPITSLDPTEQQYSVSGLNCAESIVFKVMAFDYSNNYSESQLVNADMQCPCNEPILKDVWFAVGGCSVNAISIKDHITEPGNQICDVDHYEVEFFNCHKYTTYFLPYEQFHFHPEPLAVQHPGKSGISITLSEENEECTSGCTARFRIYKIDKFGREAVSDWKYLGY
jgi:hypothetical protein